MEARVDHLVLGAASLEEGVAWCEATLGVTPGAGGEHPLMGTHNRLLRIATVDYPRAYFEVIAPQPGRVPQRPRRWFDLDDEAVRDALRRTGPRLLHFVASVPNLAAAVEALRAQGLDRGAPTRASRQTPRGLLEWQMSIRDDGARLASGTLPTLIEWAGPHPVAGMPESGVTLQSLRAFAEEPAALQRAYEGIGLRGVAVQAGPPRLCAVLETPRGRVTLDSQGL